MKDPRGDGLTPYEVWARQQGVPVVEGFGITDLRAPAFGYWGRLGCPAYLALLRGMEGVTGMYVAEIPAGGATHRLRHMYETIVLILEGSGSTVLEDPAGKSHQFEWQEGSLFAIPLNAPYRLFAAGKPALFAAVTTAPMVFDLFHNEEFVFDTPFAFRDRFDGATDYVSPDVRHDFVGKTITGTDPRRLWEVNFIPDIRAALIDPDQDRERGMRFIKFELAGNILIAHLFLEPARQYMQAHHHAGGAIVMALRSEGYSLMWPNKLGERPFESGHGDQVVRVDWQQGSVFCPPTGWFHQHFNTGGEGFLQLAIRHGSARFPTGIWLASIGRTTLEGTVTPTREGGTLIDYAHEDPAMRRMFDEALARKGLVSAMP
jgi:hypothetical protein